MELHVSIQKFLFETFEELDKKAIEQKLLKVQAYFKFYEENCRFDPESTDKYARITNEYTSMSITEQRVVQGMYF